MLALLLGALAAPAAAEVWWSATLTVVNTHGDGGAGHAGSVGCARKCETALSTPTFVRGSTTFSFVRIEDVVTGATHALEMDLSCAQSSNPPATCQIVNPPASLQFCVGTTAYALPDSSFREHRLHEGDVGWSVGDRIQLSIRTSSCASNTLPPTVTLSAAPNPVTEGSSVTVTATLSAALSTNVTIPVTVSTSGANTAEAGDVGTLTSITINSGQTAGTGTIATNQDPDGDDETFTVAFGTLPSTVVAGSVTSLEVRIVDDDPEVTLTAAPNPVAEGSSVTVTATLSYALSSAVTIPLTLTDNTAEPADHGTLASITIASGATSGTGTITTAHDPDDQDETFTVALGTLPATVVAGTPGSVQVRISDDESNLPAVTLSVSPNPVAEGSEARVTATLSRTTLSGRFVEIPLVYRYGTTERADLRSGGGIVILRGATTGYTTMFTNRDADTDDETLTVALDELGLLAVELRPGYPASVEVTITDTGGDPGDTPQDPPPQDPPPQDPPPQDPPPGGGGGGGAPPPGGGGGGTPVDPGNDEGDAPDDTGDTDGTGGTGDDDTTADDAPADVEPEPGPERVWYLPPAADPVRQGFVRVLNHSDAAGAVRITATDDAGMTYDPLTLALEARQAAHFNTTDLEDGNTAKGLTGATGTGTGGWRLALESATLDIEALAYMRTTDGFVTGMNAIAPREDGALAVAFFNPASNIDQVSMLRLVNPGEEEAAATVTGADDMGLSPGSPVRLTLPAGSSCTVDAAQLESGTGLACGTPQDGLGDGTGKWRLAVASDARLVALSLLSSPAGHLTNLSGKAAADGEDMWHVDLLPAASDQLGRQGFVRVVNRSDVRGAVTILPADDTDTRYDPLRLGIAAGATAHFNSDDLELGNRAKGLTGSTGAGGGAWRLRLYSGLDVEAHAYVRGADGFLTAMNAAAPVADAVRRVAFFNPGSNADQVSVLRLVNRSSRAAEVSIDGTDDLGLRPGTAVRILVPATDAVELTAAELESGEHDAIASGALGDGTGKWRLRVESDGVAAVQSLLSSPSGHLTNLSHADGTRGLGELPAALLPAPATVTLERAGDRHVRGRWSAVAGARYDVDLLRDGLRQEDRSLTRATSASFRWQVLPGTYAIRARSVNGDGVRGPWSTVSDEVVID